MPLRRQNFSYKGLFATVSRVQAYGFECVEVQGWLDADSMKVCAGWSLELSWPLRSELPSCGWCTPPLRPSGLEVLPDPVLLDLVSVVLGQEGKESEK